MNNKKGICLFIAQDHHNHGLSGWEDAETLLDSVLEDRYEENEEIEEITIGQYVDSWNFHKYDHDYLVITDIAADYTAVYELVEDDKKDEMFNVSFSTTGACFGEYSIFKAYEISKILTKISMQVREGSTYGVVKDTNGNTIGKWGLNDEE